MSEGRHLHEELIAAIEDWKPALQGTIQRRTPLITSATLDSLALVRLLMWIEARVGRHIDASRIDLRAEWDDVEAIVRFVERERSLR